MRTNTDILRHILERRGIKSESDIEEFLSDKPKKTYDPFLLHGMKEGVDLLLSEISKGNRVCIYGDYDADGVTASCIMASGLRWLTDDYFIYIPSRMEEGYGLNRKAIDSIAARGAGVLLTVDCGCVSFNEVEYAKSAGLTVIVTDHHNIEDTIADCIVINPKHPDSRYPFSELAGCGVAYKFVQALQRSADLPREMLTEALDMVAIGTIGDIVCLQDENRTMTKYGIRACNSRRRKSLEHLADEISLPEINSENTAFALVPHINAAGRMGTAMDAVELFMTEDDETIRDRTRRLVEYNRQRKQTQENAYNNCLKHVKGDESFIILKMDDIHEGIAGIAAGKIKDRFYRPAIIVTPADDGYLKGTGRSVPKVNLYELLNHNSSLFVRFGGHKSACGFLMKEENFDFLCSSLQKEIEEIFAMNPDIFDREIRYDADIRPGELTLELARELEKLAPFGEGNPPPKFLIEGVELSQVAFMGADGTHARFQLIEDGSCVNCVLFRKAKEKSDILLSGNKVDLVGSLKRQLWRNQERVQFIVEEIKICR